MGERKNGKTNKRMKETKEGKEKKGKKEWTLTSGVDQAPAETAACGLPCIRGPLTTLLWVLSKWIPLL